MGDWWKPKVPRRGSDGKDGMPVYGGSRKRSEEDDDGPKPLGGMDEDYGVPRVRGGSYSARGGEAASRWGGEDRTPGTIGKIKPKYFDGDEFGPASLGPAGIGELQATMDSVGMLTDYNYGVWDEPSRNAYKDLLSEANAQGLTAEQALNLRAQSVNIGGKGGAPGGGDGVGPDGEWVIGPDGKPQWVEEQYVPPALEIRTMNKKDLSRVFRSAIIDTMGQGWSQAQIDEMVEAYNWREIKLQKDAYDQQISLERADFMGERTEGGEIQTSLSMESPEAFIEDQMMQKDPEGFQAGKMVNEVIPDWFMQSLDGWV